MRRRPGLVAQADHRRRPPGRRQRQRPARPSPSATPTAATGCAAAPRRSRPKPLGAAYPCSSTACQASITRCVAGPRHRAAYRSRPAAVSRSPSAQTTSWCSDGPVHQLVGRYQRSVCTCSRLESQGARCRAASTPARHAPGTPSRRPGRRAGGRRRQSPCSTAFSPRPSAARPAARRCTPAPPPPPPPGRRGRRLAGPAPPSLACRDPTPTRGRRLRGTRPRAR